jgi:hypothetical protein
MQLSIPQPCHQQFDQMKPSSGGRYCQSCQKTVVDFTSFSDAELIDYFKQHHSNVCGRLTQYQLNNNLQSVKLKHSRFSVAQYIIGFGLSLFVPSKKIQAAVIETRSVQAPSYTPFTLPLIDTIKGKISDSNGKPIEAAYIKLLGTTLVTVTNTKGEFIFNIPDTLQNTIYSVEISAIGFINQVLKVSHSEEMLQVKLVYATEELMGDVVVVGGICKKTRWQKIKDWFRHK